MSWLPPAHAQPPARAYAAALERWWALLVIAVAVLHGAVADGPERGVLHGLAALPALWLLDPLAPMYLRARLRQHRRIFGYLGVATPREDYRLPAWVLVGHAVLLAGACAAAQGSGAVRAPWLAFALLAMLVALVLASEELWIFYALRAEARHERMRAAGLPSRTVALLRRLEGRPEFPLSVAPPRGDYRHG